MDNLDGDKNNYNIPFPHEVEGLKHIYGKWKQIRDRKSKVKKKPDEHKKNDTFTE